MKEIIYNHTASAGREIVLTGLSEELTKDNILGIINKTTGDTLFSPIDYDNISSVSYSNGTLTITLSSDVTALAANDKVLIKCYTNNDGYAKESTIGTTADSSVATTIFGWLKAIWDKLVGIVTTYPYAKEATLTDATNGLPAIKSLASSAATDAAAAKTAAQSLTSLDSDINAGKQAIAAAITSKGVPGITPQDTLVEMANGVMQIAQQPIEIDGGDMYAAQLTGDGTLWDLYKVLADMKNLFINASYEHGGQTYNFEALIVCEYYKGYDILQLQGADCYFTCDGDFYDYASPNHVWHDSDNGKMNRWVAFLYRTEGARLDITSTSISPRSMYIGGNIGTIEYFVNGRLTELVCGVEETDVVDIFSSTNFTQEFGFKTILLGVKALTPFTFANSGFLCVQTEQDVNNDNQLASNAKYVNLKYSSIKTNASSTFVLPKAELIEITAQETSARYSNYGSLIDVTNNNFLKYVNINSDIKGNAAVTIFKRSNNSTTLRNLIDLRIKSSVVSIFANYWEPMDVLADADLKATLIDNIKNHILARVSDATGGTQLVFTVSTNMYNAIASENITWNDQTMTLADAFLTKNWLLAGA